MFAHDIVGYEPIQMIILERRHNKGSRILISLALELGWISKVHLVQ